MPVHDWTRVTPGIFHHFHQKWIGEISDALNAGLLPPHLYALAEQVAGQFGPDVLTLQQDTANGDQSTGTNLDLGGVAVAVAPPKVEWTAQTEMEQYVARQNAVVIRHSSGDRVVAIVEVVSDGNKSSRHALRTFVEKAAATLQGGFHLLIVDLYPPGPRDPNGIHGAIWEEIADASYRQPAIRPLTLAAYDAGPPKTAYVQSAAVGGALPNMPLFLIPGSYISVPLEATYLAAWKSVPARWRTVLEKR